MKLARIALLAIGLFTILFGVVYLLAPAVMTDPAGFGVLSASATTDVRATYGGFQLGMGLFLVWSAGSAERVRPALLLTALSVGAVGLSRAIGLALDGGLNSFHQTGLAFETTLTLFSIFLLRRVSNAAVSHG